MKKKTLITLMALTLLFSVVFAQTALGAGYYGSDNRQRTGVNVKINTYYNMNKGNNAKVGYVSTGRQNIYYVYPSASQGEGYYPVFINRGTVDIQKPPVRPRPQPQPERPQPEPEEPPVKPRPQPQPEPEEPPVRPQPQPEPERSGSHQLSAAEQSLINMINNERVRAGLNALEIDRELSKVARLKSEDMDKNNYFSHTSPTYGSPFTMIKDFGITYRNAGENIAKTYSVERAHEGFMNSEGHRRNILTPGFTHIGVGISGYYYTEMFITK